MNVDILNLVLSFRLLSVSYNAYVSVYIVHLCTASGTDSSRQLSELTVLI